jgi:hypothetical protein
VGGVGSFWLMTTTPKRKICKKEGNYLEDKRKIPIFAPRK